MKNKLFIMAMILALLMQTTGGIIAESPADTDPNIPITQPSPEILLLEEELAALEEAERASAEEAAAALEEAERVVAEEAAEQLEESEESTEEDAEQDLDLTQEEPEQNEEPAEEAAELIEVSLEEDAEQVEESTEEAAEQVEEFAEEAAEQIEEPAEEAAELFNAPAEEAAAQIEENPVLGVPLYEILDAQFPGRKIVIYAFWGEKDYVEIGDDVLLTAVLTGYEGLDYSLRWQYSHNGHEGWNDLQGGGNTHSFVINDDNYNWFWRIAVDISGVAE